MKKTCFSIPKMCMEVCRKYVRYESPVIQKRYAKALCYYMIYDDRYLKTEGIDLCLLAFLSKILRKTYEFPRSLIADTSRESVEKYREFQSADR